MPIFLLQLNYKCFRLYCKVNVKSILLALQCFSPEIQVRECLKIVTFPATWTKALYPILLEPKRPLPSSKIQQMAMVVIPSQGRCPCSAAVSVVLPPFRTLLETRRRYWPAHVPHLHNTTRTPWVPANLWPVSWCGI